MCDVLHIVSNDERIIMVRSDNDLRGEQIVSNRTKTFLFFVLELERIRWIHPKVHYFRFGASLAK